MSIRDELPETVPGTYWTVEVVWEEKYRVTLRRSTTWVERLVGNSDYVFAVIDFRNAVVKRARDTAEALGYLRETEQ